MAGYGNRTAPDLDPNDLVDQYNDTRHGISHSNAYSGGHETYRSGTVGGAGYGNKSSSNSEPTPLEEGDDKPAEFKYGHDTKPYSGGHSHHGSGSVGGAGWGNKTGGFKESHDSTIGKLMEKAGHMMHNEKLAEKGLEKREAQGFEKED